jgi:L,D-transpeptidase YcbB
MKALWWPLLLVLPVGFILGGDPNAIAAVADEMPAAILKTLETTGPSVQIAGRPVDIEAIRMFYQQRENKPLWVDGAGTTVRGRALAQALLNAARDGLDPTDYDAGPAVLDAGSAEQLAAAELALSFTLVRYASDLRDGRALPTKIERDRRIIPLDPVQILTAVADAPDPAAFVDSLAPANAIYLGLRESLARHRAIAAAGGWPQLPDGANFGTGSIDPRVQTLRLRLKLTGDLATDAQGHPQSRFDEDVHQAVRRFQERHGLPANGVVDEQTRTLLNIPVQDRIRQILANLERARWLPDDLGDPYILVNLADFSLQVVEGGRDVMHMRVIIGEPETITPVFSDRISYIEVNPYWNIPRSIAVDEKLPVLRRNPGALKAQNIRLFGPNGKDIDPTTINWPVVNANNFNYRLRQDPGAQNTLGRIKFMFPNPYDVYLHDTPSRALFQRQVRAFSHGCIRVEKPIELATFLLRSKEGWGRARIQRTIAEGKNRTIVLKDPVSVHLVYLTAWLDRERTMQFREAENAKVTLVYHHELPNVPGKSIKGVLVEYGPGGYSAGHTHAKSAFIYATVLEGEIRSQIDDEPVRTYKVGESFSELPGDRHGVSANASKTKPAKLLAVFVVNTDETELTIPFDQ